MRYCTRINIALKAYESGNVLMYRPRCKQWSCPYCAKVNAEIWQARIMNEIADGGTEQWFFWTLTLDGKDHNGDTIESLLKWREVWDTLMKRIKRDHKKMRYVRIFETHKDGTLHVHMLTDSGYADIVKKHEGDGRDNYTSETLKKHLTELGLGWRHDIRPLETANTPKGVKKVAKYVIKYMTKAIQGRVRKLLKDADMSRVRMIQTSQKWFNEKQLDPSLLWSREPLFLSEFENLPKQNTASDITRNRTIEKEHFYDSGTYPNRISDTIDASEEYEES